MAEENRRPRGREKNVTGQGKGLNKRGEGLGTGPVGSKDGYQSKLSKQDRDLLTSLLQSQMGGGSTSSSSGAGMQDLMSLFGNSQQAQQSNNVSMQDIASLLGNNQSSSYSSQQNVSLQDIMSILGSSGQGTQQTQNTQNPYTGSSSTVHNVLGGGYGSTNQSSGLGGILGGQSGQQSSSGLNLLGGNKPSQSHPTQSGGGNGGNGGNNVFSSSQLGGSSAAGGKRRGSCLTYIIILVLAFIVISFLMRSCSNVETVSENPAPSYNNTTTPTAAPIATPKPTAIPTQAASASVQTGGQHYHGGTGSFSDWGNTAGNSTAVTTAVAQGARDKRTEILGNGEDTVTIMVYMCGTDLESRSGMGTSDLMEMTKAQIADNVNLLVFTGGCSKWNNSVVSSSVNQIYQIQTGGLARLVENAGTSAMTSPKNLTSYIKWCAENFPANRYELILWDHGSGSVAGYGYDEKNKGASSMTLAGINTALKEAGVTFDFIGFDACLMATAETAIMLEPYADYMIASEETEPGVGWYYTDWLTALSANTSQPTLEIGRNIVDTFVNTCAKKCPGQKTTLSVIDLAEYGATVPDSLNAFSRSISSMIAEKNYQQVSEARYKAREFASSSRIDQVDLIDLALKMGTSEGQILAKTLQSAVKYNRTSADMTNAYGVAIYFPYRRTDYVDSAVNTYSQIGMDSDYAACIKEVAGLTLSGQIAGGGSASPFGSLFGGSYSSPSSSSYSSSDISSLLNAFLGGDYSSMEGYSSSNTGFFSGRSMSVDETADYLAENMLDTSELVWQETADGEYIMTLSEENWELVRDLDLNLFYDDDGLGYYDLGLDNIFEFTEDGSLIADTEKTWLAVNDQIVAYYHIDTVDDGDNYKITGRIPAFLNGERVDLLAIFDNEHPHGYIAGATQEYAESSGLTLIGKNMIAAADADVESETAELVDLTTGESETVETDLTALKDGDRIDFICDYYSNDGRYEDSYMIGETMTVDGDLVISDVTLPDGDVLITYRLTDIYDREYWTESIRK